MKDETKRKTLILIGGASGSGKTTTIKAITQMYPKRYKRPLAYTSRQRREKEDTNEYEFLSRDQIGKLFNEGKLINLDEVYGEIYGFENPLFDTSPAPFLIKEVHPINHSKIKSIYPETITVLLISDSIQDKRGREEDSHYYNKLDYDQFDIVLFREHFSDEYKLAYHLETCIDAINSTRGMYPDASHVDSFNEKGYSKVSSEFSDSHRVTTRDFHTLSAPEFKEMIATIPNLQRVLEVGSGTGWFETEVGPFDFELEKVELTRSMTEKDNGNRSVTTTVRRMPYQSNFFDLVVCSLGDPYAYPLALCEINRVLKPYGKVAFTTPSKEWAKGIRKDPLTNRTKFLLKSGDEAIVYSFTYTPREIKKLFSFCGFENVINKQLKGDNLNQIEISKAIVESATNQQKDIRELSIVNFTIATKPGA